MFLDAESTFLILDFLFELLFFFTRKGWLNSVKNQISVDLNHLNREVDFRFKAISREIPPW